MPQLPVEEPNLPDNVPMVSIIVPARNEEKSIERCVRSLLAQDYPRFEVIVVDDCSEDATGQILARIGNADSRLKVIKGKPLPEGWMGKAHAICQGYRLAKGDWLLFTDADTYHASSLLSRMMGFILPRPVSLATAVGKQTEPGIVVSLVNLAVLSYIFMVSDRKGLADSKSRQSLVNGQYVLMTREAYEAVGTHSAVREYSSTDVSLGYLAKLKGFITMGIDAGDALQTTLYFSFVEAYRGWSRSLVNGIWTALGPMFGSLALLLLTVGLLFFWVVPWQTWLGGMETGNGAQVMVGSLQILAVFCVLWMQSGKILKAILDLILLPVSFLFFMAMVGSGLTGAWFRRGTVWKGRTVLTAKHLPPWKPSAPRPRGQ